MRRRGLCCGELWHRVLGAMHRVALVARMERSEIRDSFRSRESSKKSNRPALGLRCAPSGLRGQIFLRNLKIPIDAIPSLLYIFRVLFDEGPLSRSGPSADRAKAGRTAAPRNGR